MVTEIITDNLAFLNSFLRRDQLSKTHFYTLEILPISLLDGNAKRLCGPNIVIKVNVNATLKQWKDYFN